ncbi:MAG: isoprenylcysteine carboxylmethyltransferase family protein [Terriglobales bacterium]
MALSAAAMVYIVRVTSADNRAARWVGLAIALIGLAGVFVARYTLGKSFSITAKARALVTTGIYSRIRNPIYVSGEIFLIGMTIMLEKPMLLVLIVVIVPIQIWRARIEARVLEEKFGDEYREYRRRTWF